MNSSLDAPATTQVAALCHRNGTRGVEVLLITSSSGRWILPKGWPEAGLSDAEAAQQEAWEEAGIKDGVMRKEPFARFITEKRFDNGAVVPCAIDVFTIAATHVSDVYPEAHKRERRWMSIPKAVKLVDDPALRNVLKAFAA
ncbi:NUDIX hydrolase [Yoonia sp. 2307UL14-13]